MQLTSEKYLAIRFKRVLRTDESTSVGNKTINIKGLTTGIDVDRTKATNTANNLAALLNLKPEGGNTTIKYVPAQVDVYTKTSYTIETE